MGEITEKAKGIGNKVAGATKVGVGKATDNSRLEAEGKAQKLKGSAQQVKGEAKGAVGNKV